MDLDPLTVAIDGPAGSGKSSVARDLARRLGLTHLDTGAMYRALTWVALRESLPMDDGEVLASRLGELELRWEAGELWVAGERCGPELRGDDVTAHVSQLSAHGAVRREMQRRQRDLAVAADGGAVMEGRDIGSRVLPLAPCKIYLDASPRERARRRVLQEGRAPEAGVLEEVERDLRRRDEMDSSRAESPLLISPDAHVLDTSSMSLEEVIDRSAELAEQSRPRRAPEEVMEPLRFQHRRYRWIYAFIRGLLERWFGLEVRGHGHDQLPEGLIYACNHVSWWDPPVIGASLGREVHFLAKRELFVGPLGWFIRAFNAIPIVRGRYDKVAFDTAQALLRGGGNLLIFPEGTRRPVGRPGPVKKGLGILVTQTGQPYVPCYVEGTCGLFVPPWGKPPLRAWLGPPVRLHALAPLRERLSEREIQARVGELYMAQLEAFLERSRSERKRSV